MANNSGTGSSSKSSGAELAKEDPNKKALAAGAEDFSGLEALSEDNYDDGAAKTLNAYAKMPRLVIIQKQSSSERQEIGGIGAAVLMPDEMLVAKAKEEFIAIPVFAWPSFEVRSDYNDEANQLVMEQSLDEMSDIAKRSRNPNTRSERYGEKGEFVKQYCTVINYAFWLPELKQLAVHSFAVGEFSNGQKLTKLIKDRRDKARSAGKYMPIFANRLSLSVQNRKRGKNEWHGFDFNNPKDGQYIADAETIEYCRGLNEGAKEAYNTRAIGAVEDDPASGGGHGGGTGSADYQDDDLPGV